MASMHPGRRTAISLASERPKGIGQPCLVIIAGEDLGRRIDLGQDEVAIGRSEQCTICVNSDLVSRRHAAVSRVLGKYCLIDTGSTNGTFVNDQRVERAELKDGDLIRVGKTILKYLENSLELEYLQRIYALATADALTGAYNKRHFDDTFGKEVTRATQSGGPLALVLFDIDHFKHINDSHGHLAGDAVLKHLVLIVKQELRESDALCRVGGEEFALLFPNTAQSIAFQTAELLRQAIANNPCDFDGARIPFTISAGVVEWIPSEGAAQFYKRADVQLYAAKHQGRNRVC